MKTNLLTSALALLMVVSTAYAQEKEDAKEDMLTIGSKAPALDVEHWVQDGNGKFKPVTKFEDGKVYIVEFWATWCGPCIASMPHISEIQDKYASRGVQVVSISDEDLETVEKFLKREVRGEEDKTYADLTSNYCLTTDPDESVYEDYMRAAGQNGIPTAFIVGKSGIIEWIGHPMRMDQPLEEVVEGKWDRDKFASDFIKEQKMQKTLQSVFSLAQRGKTEEAIEKLDSVMADAPEGMKTQLAMMRFSMLVSTNDKRVGEAFTELVGQVKDNPQMLNQLAWSIVEMEQSGEDVDAKLINAAREAADMAVKKMPNDSAILDTQAHLAHLQGKLDEAITIQTKAVENADESMKSDLAEYLDELKKEKGGSDDQDGQKKDDQ